MAVTLVAGVDLAPPGMPELPEDPVGIYHRARRLYLHGQSAEALRELRRLEGRRVPPEVAAAAQELGARIARRLWGPW